MNVTNLVLQLQSKITDNMLDQQMISKAISQLKLGAVDTTATYSQLPAPSTVPGNIYYVQYDGLYFSNGSYWVRIAASDYTPAYIWGNVRFFASGDPPFNTSGSYCAPIPAGSVFSDWCDLSAGGSANRVVGIRTNRTAWQWGSALYSVPTLVPGGFTDWVRISSGSLHHIGLRSNGTLMSWGNPCGSNSFGQQGTGGVANATTPALVAGGFTDWCQVSAGGCASAGIRTNGTLWAWGLNNNGAIGDGTVICRSSPVSVVGGFTDWCKVSVGGLNMNGLRTNGSAWSWGSNSSGRLGDGTVVSRSSPVSVVGGVTFSQIESTGTGSVGISNTNILWSWGLNSSGQVGDNTNICRSSPVTVVGGFTDWCSLAAGLHGLSKFALRTNGTVWGWGDNSSGVLGTGTLFGLNVSSPVSVAGGFTDWCQVSTGDSIVFGLRKISL